MVDLSWLSVRQIVVLEQDLFLHRELLVYQGGERGGMTMSAIFAGAALPSSTHVWTFWPPKDFLRPPEDL